MEKYQIKIKQYESESLLAFESGDFKKAVSLFHKAWKELPEPKIEKPESYSITRSAIVLLLKLEKYTDAHYWQALLRTSDLSRPDDGDRELVIGICQFHLNQADIVWYNFFEIANTKSGGKCFANVDKKYLDFFQNSLHYNIKMFPEPEAVFATDDEQHAQFLFPLFSVNLSRINPLWDGKLHMLQFNEDPYNTETATTFNEYCRDRMIAFDVTDGKYSFKTDFNYFSLTKDWEPWFEKTKEGYGTAKEFYKANGWLQNKGASYNRIRGILEQIGGEPEWMQYDETPIDPEGNPMTFICRVYTANYMTDSCSKDLYLFYSHNCKLAVLLYQIT